MESMDVALKIAEVLTPLRLKILRSIVEEKHPEELAKDFGLTRQAMDKHLSILYSRGFLAKIVKYEGRPKVYYRLTDEGDELLRNFEGIANDFLMALRNRYKEELFTIDRMLVDGEISEGEYKKKKRTLDMRYGWVMKK